MDLIKGIKERRSIRKFQNKKIPREVIEEIVETARFAPSWKNTQIVRYFIIDDEKKIAEIASEKCTYGFTYNIKTLAGAAAIAILTYVEGISGYEKDGSFSTQKGDRWQMFDAGIAAQTFCLAAFEKGVGTVIQGYFDEEEIKKVVGIPKNQKIGAVIPMGYPLDGEVKAPPRKEAGELVTFI